MDLRSLKIHLPERRISLVLRDAAGDGAFELTGDPFDQVIAAAEPLLVRLAQEGGGPVQHLAIDPLQETLRAICLKQSPATPQSTGERDLLHQHGANMGEVGEVPPHLSALTLEGADFRHLAALMREPARLAVRAARPRQPDLPGPAPDSAVWEHKYRVGSEGWELMRPAPPLERWLAQHPPAPGSVALVPGCGRGHEARLLGSAGARVTAIDIAPTAVADARRLALETGLGAAIEVRQADLFALPQDEAGRYDLALEHCCFCAIDPDRRGEYVEAMHQLLRPGGQLLGLFWCHGQPGGPPYSTTRQEIEDRFAVRFRLIHEEVPSDSVLVRAGQELLVLMDRHD